MTSENRTVVITGGTKGVGRAAAERLAALGYNLALSYSAHDAAAEATPAAVASEGRECLIVKGRFGPIYAVIANAGVENVEAPFAEMAEAELDRVVDINFKGTF
jgi:3-oxoacyl-[acyl-carrier protein] reductase